MLNKNSRRLAALSLALLLVLCAGCGSSPAPVEDTPEPSQTPAAPEPTPTPELPPEPEAAATATDVNAPASGIDVTGISIEREAPESLQLISLGSDYTLTDADGQTLTRGGSGVSGTMTYTQQQLPEAGGDMFSALIPYSSDFTFEVSKASGSWGFEFLATACPWCHCVARGSGKLTGFEYVTGSSLTVRTEPGAELELTLPMAGSSLGESGWIRLHLTAGGNEVSLAVEGEGGGFSFSGVDPSAPVLLDYDGTHSANGLDLAPDSSSGSVGFANLATAEINVTAS